MKIKLIIFQSINQNSLVMSAKINYLLTHYEEKTTQRPVTILTKNNFKTLFSYDFKVLGHLMLDRFTITKFVGFFSLNKQIS